MTMRRFRRMRRRPPPTTDTRSPDERLEALVRERNPDRRGRMMGRIHEDLEARPETIGAWITAARTLADRLIISFHAFHYFAAIFAEAGIMAASERDDELVRLANAIEAVERDHGLRDDESFHVDDAPDDWRALDAEWNSRADAIMAEIMRGAGHADVAEAMLRDRDAFDREVERGHHDIWPETDEEF
jgi:hypothetical protein